MGAKRLTGRAHRTFVFSRALRDSFEGAPALPTEPVAEPEHPVASLDAWARYTWRHRRGSAAVLLAVPLWLAIRVGYAMSSAAARCSRAITRPFLWTFWRLYEICGPIARLGKHLFWRVIYPLLELVGRALKWLYWRCYAVCGLPARLGKNLFWGAVGALGLVSRAPLWCYRKLGFPPISTVASLPGLHQRKSSPRKKCRAKAASNGSQIRAESLRAILVEGLDDSDAIAWIANDVSDFEPLFDFLPRFGFSSPTAAALFVLFEPSIVDAGERQLRLLGLRLRGGAPCQRLFLYAPDSATAEALATAFDVPVHVLSGCHPVDFIDMVRARALIEPPSLQVTKFGPVVLLVSALWGRVGSTLIFDSQTQFLIENGAIVVRVFVDHYPSHGADRTSRRDGLVAENLTITAPHLYIVAEREERGQPDLRRRADYKGRSAVRRLELELANAAPTDGELLRWAGEAASLTIVNHAIHMAFAERISSAPIVLETHDILVEQLDCHGWPNFVELRNEPKHLRESDQQDMWMRAKACVNLSPDDHAQISAHAPVSVFVRPSAEPGRIALRAWSQVVSANNLPEAFAESEEIDILLWGDWHEGNARAVTWFLQEVLPSDPALAQARIAIIGRVTRILPNKKWQPNVMMTGFVDKLEDFFGRAKVLAIADQDGSGVSIKAIETIRYGKAFVSTRFGLRGLDIEGVGAEPRETAPDFAADIVTLLDDAAARAKRAEVAAALYAKNISHDTYERQWRQVLAAVAPNLCDQGPRETARAASSDGLALLLQELHMPRAAAAAPTASATASAQAPAVRTQRSTHVLAAVICTYNRYDVLPGAIESLLRQDIDVDDLDILVVDNSPDQVAAERFGRAYAHTRVRYLLEPIAGLSNARNVGAESSRAKYVAYIDDDAVAAPDWARKLVTGFQAMGPDVGVAGGRIIPRWLSARPEWLPDELIGNLSIVDWGGATRLLGASEWLAGCNIAFERQPLLDLGGFSRALGRVGAGVALLSNEESAVMEKFAEVGRRTIYVPEATVEHLINPSRLSQEWFRRRSAWQAVSDYIKDPQKASSYAGAAAERLRREIREETMPPGFVRPHAEREAFRRDVGLMYDVVIAMLAGGVELNEDGSSNASLHDKVVANVRREVQRHPKLRDAIRKFKN